MTVPIVRVMSLAEVATLVDWAAAEGWNPGVVDAAAFYATDPEGFIGAFVDGELVAGIAAVAYGKDYGFIGLYISRTDMRGRGYGKLVWDAGMRRLVGRTIGLDGVDEQLKNYRRKGFAAAYRTIRYSGRLSGVAAQHGAVMKPVAPDAGSGLSAFDRSAFGAPREAFLEAWLGKPHVALAIVEDNLVTGYGVARQCRVGWKIGPLFASRAAAAINLAARLSMETDGDIVVDVPETRADFSADLLRRGFEPVFRTTRMYSGPERALSPSVYGITTLELG